MINLLVDFREKSFINELSKSANIVNEAVTPINIDGTEFICKVTNLEVGDFIIKDSEDTKFVIERKTYRDLSSSITDGRFRQQKARLDESVGDASKIVFVIEGGKSTNRMLPDSTISSSIINMIFRHNYKVICTANEDDTFKNIVLLVKKIAAQELDKSTSPVAPIKLISRGAKIKGNLMAIQLSAIPGVSFQTALCISSRYNSMKELIMAYDACEDEESRRALLRTVELTTTRKLGPALSKKIYEACCGIIT
jgi:ERCC4-type nuclease